MTRPELLIEQWLPVQQVGIESVRERAVAMDLPPLFALHVWWARRPLVASGAAVLASLLPAWSPDVARAFPNHPEFASEEAYHAWFLRLLGIVGDPIAAQRRRDAARAAGERLQENPFGYKQAYKNSPEEDGLRLLAEVLSMTWGRVPVVLDPTAGGGSIPFQAVRYGLPCYANDLNPIAAAVLRAGIELPIRWGSGLIEDLQQWGGTLVERLANRLGRFFPAQSDEAVGDYVFARTVACPRTGKPVPLAPNWWLSRDKGGVAVRLVTERVGQVLDAPEFEVVRGPHFGFDPDDGTMAGGKAVSPWDHRVIEGDYIKGEAQAGRMGSALIAVVVRNAAGHGFRAPSRMDLEGISAAEQELNRLLPRWDAEDLIPNEAFPLGNDIRPVTYGMPRWRDMYSPRQLLAHGCFVEEFRRLLPEVRSAIPDGGRAQAVLALLGLLVGKAVPWNSLQSRWDQSRNKVSQAFDTHAFPFRSTYAEFEAAQELYSWCLNRGTIRAYRGIVGLLRPEGRAQLSTSKAAFSAGVGEVTVSCANAGNLVQMGDGSVDLVCIDPPYYDNVMYAELADFFYVWEKRTLGLVWPELFRDELTDKANEAVANVARFASSGARKRELANADYEAKMTAIFAECHRVLQPDGVLTVMFTHKRAEAWDTLGTSLLDAGFSIETSWPVPTESEQSLHQVERNAAASTIFLVCRKRPGQGGGLFFEQIESEIRRAAREALTRFANAGLSGVDLLLSTYGPVLSVLSQHWPVLSSEPDAQGNARRLRPEEALDVARAEVVRLQRAQLVGREIEFDPITDWYLIAWDTFRAAEFPFDLARRLGLSCGGLDMDELERAKVIRQKAGTVELLAPDKRLRRDSESELPGVHQDRVVFPVLLDALHTALYVAIHDGAAAAKAWLDQRGLARSDRFVALLQAAANAIPRAKVKGNFTRPEAQAVDRLVTAYYPDITLPADPLEAEQERLFE